jgi:hemerythrin-like domain-containing protein
MDAFELLKTDHEKVAQLFDQLEAASGNAKLNVFKQIRTELELHTHIEETIFYPALEKPEATHDLTLEAYEEHAVVKNLLSELDKARTADDEWEAKAKVLRENVEHHVEEEENELFDKASDALSDQELEVLGDRMSAEKSRKQGKAAKSGKQSKSKQASDNRGGMMSRIANFVSGGESAEKSSGRSAKKASKKQPASKASSKSSSTSKKSSAKKASKKTGRGANASASKRSSTAQSTKRVAAKRTSKTTKQRSAKGGKKAAKKSSRKK